MYNFYSPPPDNINWFQGDIIKKVRFPSVVSSETLVIGSDGRISNSSISTASFTHTSPAVRAAVEVSEDTVILISQTCDMERDDRNDVILVCPLRGITEFRKDSIEKGKPAKDVDKLIDRLRIRRAGELEYFFYLPRGSEIEECYANYMEIVPIHKSLLSMPNRVVSMSAYGRQWLQSSLSNFFARPFLINPPTSTTTS